MPGTLRADVLDLLGERPVEHDGDHVGVVPQVDELVGGVAVVGVDHGEADLERGEERLQVLGRVVQVLRDLVLFRGTGCEQRRGDAVGATVELRPRERAVALLLREGVGDLVGHRLPEVGEVPSVVVCHGGRTYRRRITCHVGSAPAVGCTVTGRGSPVVLGPWRALDETVVGGGDGRVLVRSHPTSTRSTTSHPHRRRRPGEWSEIEPSITMSNGRSLTSRVDPVAQLRRSRRGSGGASAVVVDDLGDHPVPRAAPVANDFSRPTAPRTRSAPGAAWTTCADRRELGRLDLVVRAVVGERLAVPQPAHRRRGTRPSARRGCDVALLAEGVEARVDGAEARPTA